jgi:hypothetical protein
MIILEDQEPDRLYLYQALPSASSAHRHHFVSIAINAVSRSKLRCFSKRKKFAENSKNNSDAASGFPKTISPATSRVTRSSARPDERRSVAPV